MVSMQKKLNLAHRCWCIKQKPVLRELFYAMGLYSIGMNENDLFLEKLSFWSEKLIFWIRPFGWYSVHYQGKGIPWCYSMQQPGFESSNLSKNPKVLVYTVRSLTILPTKKNNKNKSLNFGNFCWKWWNVICCRVGFVFCVYTRTALLQPIFWQVCEVVLPLLPPSSQKGHHSYKYRTSHSPANILNDVSIIYISEHILQLVFSFTWSC